MTATAPDVTRPRLRLLAGIRPIQRDRVVPDVMAGVALSAMSIPGSMGYTQIAGMPVVTGLYANLLPVLFYGLFGASRHLVVGADSATAAVMAAGLAGIAAQGSPEYVAYAGVLALITAGLLLLARVFGLAFLADFLSRTVLIGFLTGVGIQVAIGQLPAMLGIPAPAGGALRGLIEDITALTSANPATIAISLVVLAILYGAPRIDRRIPGALIALVLLIIVSMLVDLPAYGVSLLGPIPGGLPQIALPSAGLDFATFERLLPTALSLFIVILAQSSATSRAYAARYNEKTDEDTDLVGLAMANVGAGITGTFIVNGSPTKTQFVDKSGGRSQIAQLTTGAITVLVLLFLTGPLSYMPNAVLAAIVFQNALTLIDLQGLASISRQRRAEFWVALVTTLAVVVVGVEEGIVVAIVISLLVHTRHGYKPHNTVLVDDGGHLRTRPAHQPAQLLPGLIVYRFSHSMYYANADGMAEELLSLAKSGPAPLRWLAIDLVAVDDVDYTAADVLRHVVEQLQDGGVHIALCEMSDRVRDELVRSGVIALLGDDTEFDSVDALVEHYRQRISAA